MFEGNGGEIFSTSLVVSVGKGKLKEVISFVGEERKREGNYGKNKEKVKKK